MRFVLVLSAFLAMAVGLACNHAAAPEIKKASNPTPVAPAQGGHDHEGEAGVTRISVEDAKKEFDAGKAVFVDTRDVSSHRFARIKGAVHLPAEAAQVRWKELPTDKKLIVYCS